MKMKAIVRLEDGTETSREGDYEYQHQKDSFIEQVMGKGIWVVRKKETAWYPPSAVIEIVFKGK